MSNPSPKPRNARSGCIKAAVITVGIAALLAIGATFLIHRALTDFDSQREVMALRSGLVVEDEHLRFHPGMDGAMSCRFTVAAGKIDEVFDTTRVDVSEFDEEGYKFNVDWIDEQWWDADRKKLTGGSIDLGADEFMRVGYIDNENGTLTVYIFWFEV